ncbi:hypothetical protein E2C01_069450 [Portunus trituberculatus]|uniref:Uncharacterized protein n=1 Tax=Portunus trituberculatus TaxID=210409 RepID=A0A5B7HZE0_PORTR|nr:hypothetical protein [Portunus trituberculatus]
MLRMTQTSFRAAAAAAAAVVVVVGGWKGVEHHHHRYKTPGSWSPQPEVMVGCARVQSKQLTRQGTGVWPREQVEVVSVSLFCPSPLTPTTPCPPTASPSP